MAVRLRCVDPLFSFLSHNSSKLACWYSVRSGTAHVPIYEEETQALLLKKPEQPPNPKRLRVGVVGMPNVGKSTLINTLCGTTVLAQSEKMDTTITNALAVLTKDETQIEFYDSPGIRSRNKSKRVCGNYTRATLPGECMQKSDLCVFVVDLVTATNIRGTLCGLSMFHLIQNQHVPSILVLNKADKIHHTNELLPLITILTSGIINGKPFGPKDDRLPPPIEVPTLETDVVETFINLHKDQSDADTGVKNERRIIKDLNHCTGWPHFQEVFVVSALFDQQTDKLRNYLCSKAVPQPWKYHSELVTDKTPHEITVDAARSTLMENLDEEIPYKTKTKIVDWQYRNNVLHIYLELVCVRAKHITIIEKKGRTIAFGIKRRLRAAFNVEVECSLVVTC